MFASLDFRRAPEYQHPAALEDAYHAFRWLLDNRERIESDGRCAVVGESSGGTMAVELTLLLRDAGAPAPDYQVIAYPLVDRPDRWPSYEKYASGYTLDRAQIEWHLGHIMPAGGLDETYLLPLTATDFTGLPPALVMTTEFDPLRDEGVAFADQLGRAGGTVEHIHAADQMHGFLMVPSAVAGAGMLVDRRRRISGHRRLQLRVHPNAARHPPGHPGHQVSAPDREFTTARACARHALAQLGLPASPITNGPNGELRWPAGVVGSITHCEGYRAVAHARAGQITTIGIDAEPHQALPPGVLDSISDQQERHAVGELNRSVEGVHWDRLLFSAKESIYKAWFPLRVDGWASRMRR
jgi:hypothetical protein